MTNIESAKNLPSPFDPYDKLQEKFRNFNLDNTDLVVLQGNVDYLYLPKHIRKYSRVRFRVQTSTILYTMAHILISATNYSYFRSAHFW